MKTLKELLLENLLLEESFECKNYDDVVELAKNNPSFNVVKSGWGSSGKAFELQLGKLNLVVDFVDSRQCIYMFVDNNKNQLYSPEATVAEKVDWDKLFNNTLDWLVDTKYHFMDALKYSTQKAKAAERKYHKTDNPNDFNTLKSMESRCRGIEGTISKIDNLIKLYK